ncbi:MULTISPECIES: phosphonate ABC transporter, permease protein PhnE [Oceanobacillus]|uniref:Phosphonate ABC transporter permease n=1 Tax=Oceanobacillus kimchii TaxID=746691 RepID=A0ABQ5TEZ4_9BACI|nr:MULTISPECIES: phosphonate ABC transporter, permease protein PhnE [Oceanobacillus]MBT2599317.1 phosphonate ABC transporter, permease protein PhnE [Oceanobacillus sp. ISL-74]MBT2652235.1 phosphonate ABC transporter, permease protein PhnE [Oceanobacillus sp. ISL-73]MCT1578486.1 phosphonate ABC transporter, permease protein PhnE [Oceanobacillus kimchii]MCT2136465.1 phosphonate ABC transporter, permease protein PhnE [Oceanobacillus kimchii]OEH54126.1 phosphonate ABC transporter permease [Oceanob
MEMNQVTASIKMRRKRNGQINIKSGNKIDLVVKSTIWILSLLTILAFFFFNYSGLQLERAIPETWHNLRVMFLEPALNHFSWQEAVYQIGVTLGLGVLATVLGAIIAFFLALMAAENLSKPWISKTVRIFVAFVRAVPTVLWVLIFAIAAGLGSEAAVLGMLFHSVAYLVKAFSESFEEVDAGILEALRASGSKWWHVIVHGVLPSTFTYLLSWTFLRFEINFSVAVAMGAAAGAGGIGFELFMASGFYFDLREVGFITYAILLIAIILEITSTRLKNRYFPGQLTS